MAFNAPTFDIILAGILRDIRNLQPEADIGNDSDHYIRSAAVSAAIEGLYQRLAWLYRQVFADIADDDELIRTAALRGVLRKPAVAATGTVELSGAAGIALLAGSILNHRGSGASFATQADTTIGSDGRAQVSVQAQTPGVAFNDLTGSLTLSSPPLGMDSAAAFSGETAGGADQESVESLLARYLDLIQQPPAGGTVYDYARWAKEVPGVADALVLARRRGAGTVDIAITGLDGAPSERVRAAAQAHIESTCSVIADIAVILPLERQVDGVAQVELDGDYSMAQVQLAAQAAYEQLLGSLKPGETLKRSQIEAMVSNLAGVLDRTVTAPAANVPASDTPSVIGWIRPGTFTLEALA